MDWVRSRSTRTHAGRGRKASLTGPESLETRQLLAASQGDGTDAVTFTPAISSPAGSLVQQIQWAGHSVETRIDHWNGRLATTPQPTTALLALPLESSVWRVVSLGNGYFSLTTPGASQQDVLAWAAHTPGISAFEPDFVLQTSSLPNDPGFSSQWGLNNTAIGGYGVIGDIIVGILGALVGGFLFNALGVSAGPGLAGNLITATVGAIALIFLLRLLRRV